MSSNQESGNVKTTDLIFNNPTLNSNNNVGAQTLIKKTDDVRDNHPWGRGTTVWDKILFGIDAEKIYVRMLFLLLQSKIYWITVHPRLSEQLGMKFPNNCSDRLNMQINWNANVSMKIKSKG